MKAVPTLILLVLSANLLSACSANTAPPQPISQQISIPQATGDNSRNSLDWAGTYKATLPCASCAGIETTLTLNSDGTYNQTSNYLGEKDGIFNEQGTFTWDNKGSNITLSNGSHYKVGENQIFMLGADGKVVSGSLADNYRLKKQ